MKLKKYRKFKIECSIKKCKCLFFSNYIKILPGILYFIDDYDNSSYFLDLEKIFNLKITELEE